jgi:site-specific DNA-methyltransferase (adenine-specific)
VRPGEEPQTDQILLGENLQLLPSFADGCFQLIYIDPPFNTGRAQVRKRCPSSATSTATC